MYKFIYPRIIRTVTGGHRYEARLRKVLSERTDVATIALNEKEELTVSDKLRSPMTSLRLLRKIEKGDIAVFNSSSGFYLLPVVWGLRLMGRQTMVIHHHFMYEEFKGVKRGFYRLMEHLMLKGATRRLTPSPYILDKMKGYGDTELLPIPFDVIEGTPMPCPGRLLYVGTIEPRKGLHLMMEALLQRPERRNFELHIVGKCVDMEYKAWLHKVAREGDLQIRFPGMIGEDELRREYENADLFLFPSIIEGFGMAMNEARFYGLPVVGFSTSAIPLSITDGEDGFLIEPFDTATFGRRVAQLVSDRGLRGRMGQKALERSRRLPGLKEFRDGVSRIFFEGKGEKEGSEG
ncbi:MAG: glycosyltransferase family 4 protein [Muribaculaceae bacterium]|nr:glycosyltransferase family 4 protein [Muribaculaceae bacterium]